MTAEINRDVDRPSEDVVETLREVSAADVHEAMDKTGALSPDIARVTGETLCGPATTVRLPTGDNMMVHVGAKLARPGDVLVIEANTTTAATWGELATRNALRKGLEGVVSSGNVRDVEAVDELGFPVFGRAVSQMGAVKETPGSVNVPVAVGDEVIEPGDVVVGDADGVTVAPGERAGEVAEAAVEYREREDEIRRRIEDGESLFEITDYEALLAEHDVPIGASTDGDDGDDRN